MLFSFHKKLKKNPISQQKFTDKNRITQNEIKKIVESLITTHTHGRRVL